MNKLDLKLELLEYWHTSSGGGLGAVSDAEPVTDEIGLPYLPGKTLKGILREALLEASLSGLSDVEIGDSARLFGAPLPDTQESSLLRDVRDASPRTSPLHVSNAEVPGLRDYLEKNLESNERRAMISSLFERFSTTALEGGVARPRSLRTVTVVVPLELRSSIFETRPVDFDWKSKLRASLPFARSLGSFRHRGFGRAAFSVVEE